MSAYLSLIGRRRGGRLFEAGRLLTFSAFRMGACSRWALIRGWALIRINTVVAATTFRTPSPTFALWTGLAVYRSVWVDEGCQAVLQN